MTVNARRLEALRKAFEQNAEIAHRKVALEVFSRVVKKTPVDSGHARANWQVAIEDAPAGILDTEDKRGAATMTAIAATVQKAKPDQKLILANNLPYVETLEYGLYPDGPGTTGGFSRQAPAGMVRQTIAEYFGIAREVVDEVFKR